MTSGFCCANVVGVMKKKSPEQSRALEEAKSLMSIVAGLLKEGGEPGLSMQQSAIASKLEVNRNTND